MDISQAISTISLSENCFFMVSNVWVEIFFQLSAEIAKIEIIYKSVYEESWKLNGMEGAPLPLNWILYLKFAG